MSASWGANDNLGPSLGITTSNLDPNVVEPGNDLTVDFNILNSGDEMSRDVKIEVEENDVFFFKEKYLSNDLKYICAGCSYDATYYFTVKPNIVSGIYPITFDIIHDDNQITTQTINVKVQGIPDLIINKDNLEGKKLYPSEEFNLEITLNNVGTSNAKNIKVTSSMPSIIKVGSDTDYINNIKINEEKVISNKFKIDENLDPGLYQIPFTITFEDDFGNSYTKTINVGVEVLNSAQLDIQYLKLNSYSLNLFKEFEISGMIENIGYGEAKNIYVTAQTDLEGFKKSFVGTLDKDEDSPIQFRLKANEVGNHEIKLVVHFTDDFGEHSIEESLNVQVTKPTNQLYTIIGVIVVLVLLILGKKLMKKN